MSGTRASILSVLMLYHRLASEKDTKEDAELRELEGGDVQGGASRGRGMHHLPTVTGVQVGCTSAQDAMRMGAVFVASRRPRGHLAYGRYEDTREPTGG